MTDGHTDTEGRTDRQTCMQTKHTGKQKGQSDRQEKKQTDKILKQTDIPRQTQTTYKPTYG